MIELDYIEVTQPIGTFYMCSISASTLLKVVNVQRRSVTQEGVQRDLSEKRIKDIAEYCSDPDSVFPTPIVISVNSSANVDIDEIRHKVIIHSEDKSIGDVIDGQHRLWGIARSSNLETFMLPVVMMFGMTLEEKAYIFSTINSNQVKVPQSLIYELFDVSSFRSPQKTVHQLARVMNNSTSSPLFNRLKMLGKKEPDQMFATLSQGTFAKSILPLISKNPEEDARKLKRNITLTDDSRCVLRGYFIQEKDDVIAKILLNCFAALKNVFYDEWETPHSNILWKTTGFRAVIYALPYMMRKGTNDKNLTQKFFEACFNSFRKILDKDRISLTSRDFPGGGEQGQKMLARKIIDAVSNMNIDDSYYCSFNEFAAFVKGLSVKGLDDFEIYELSEILQGKRDKLMYFYCYEVNGSLKIASPYNNAAVIIPTTQTEDSLRFLENEYMDGMDAKSWYSSICQKALPNDNHEYKLNEIV